ncbi:MAG TPA: type II secretion system F family protein [Candidatus Acidoferrales bacterium]|nr:type II secretion system F family protein [Candidatus Acidoferrales bacterium]
MITVVGGLIAAAGVFLLVVGLGQARARPLSEGPNGPPLTNKGRAPSAWRGGPKAAPAANTRERLNRVFEPLARRTGKGNAKRGRLPLSEQLAKADLKLRTSEFLMIQVGAVGLLALVGLWRFGVGPQMILLGIAGYFAPGIWVKRRMAGRLKAFNNQLGDTLVLLSNALKAGYSFAQAIDTVAKNATPPISVEFARAVREMNLGGSVDEALQNMTRRIESPDFDLVVIAVAIHRTVGGNLAEILDNIAHTIRDRIRIKGEIKTLTAQASASGTLITFLPIVLGGILYLITPTYFRPMTQSFIGWAMLGIAAFLIFIGNLIIRRVVAIEV